MRCAGCGRALDEAGAIVCGPCEGEGRAVHVCGGCRARHLEAHLPELECHDCGVAFRAPYWSAEEPRCTPCHNARERARLRESLRAVVAELVRRGPLSPHERRETSARRAVCGGSR